MTFGYESILLNLDYSTLKLGLDLVMCVIAVVLFGLFMRVQTGKSAAWFDILEKLIGVGFLGASTAAMFLLPLTKEAVIIYLVWYYFQAALYHFLPGKTYNGLELAEQRADGRKILPYKCNGLLAFIITMISYFGGGYLGLFKLSIFWDNFLPLLNAVNIFSFATTCYLMLRGFFSKDVKPNRVSTGNPAEDFWYGLELNPRGIWGGLETGFFDFDIKFFSESRPGLILWVLINFSIAASQYEQLGYVTTPMILVSAFHFIYVCDYFVVEEYIVSTIDIIHERFGWMLVWGDYAWVPFFYVQQAIYLYFLPRQHSTTYNVINVLVFLLGYAVFRGSNRQKHKYKENPKGNVWFKKPVTLKDKFPEAKRGGHLLISGWWGLARHINYLGDLILAFSWGMTCHFESYMPYLYLVFMTGLLLHRFARDDKKCAAKYGKDWDLYCKAVPYKLIPYVW